jgi:hypothetical protein
MKKRLVSGLLSCGLALSLLVGCGSSASNQQENESAIESAVESTVESTIESEEEAVVEESSVIEESVEESSFGESSFGESSVGESSVVESSFVESSVVESSVGESSVGESNGDAIVVEVQGESGEVAEAAASTADVGGVAAASLYSADEYISIVKSELIKNGIQWYPDSDEYKECRALFPDIYIGPDGGMGWAIIDVDMSNPYYVSQELLDGFKFDRLEYFYIEVLSSSNGNIQFKLYRG